MAGRMLFWDVDTQVDFMLPSGSLYVHGAEALRPNLGRLTTAARAQRIPIVHSTDDHDRSDEEIDEKRPDFVDTFPPHCLRGTPGAERVPETAPAPDALDIPWDGIAVDPAAIAAASEIILRKKRFDVFANPATPVVLGAFSPDTVVVYGVALDVCNRYAVDGMLDLGGFAIVVVSDASAAIVPGTARQLLSAWRERGVRVATTVEVLAEVGAA